MIIGKVVYSNESEKYSVVERVTHLLEGEQRCVAPWRFILERFPQRLEVGECIKFRCSRRFKGEARAIYVLDPGVIKRIELHEAARKEFQAYELALKAERREIHERERADWVAAQKKAREEHREMRERARIEKLRVERRTNDIRKFAEADTNRSAVVEDFLASRRERRRTGNGEPE